MGGIAENIRRVRERMALAALGCGRSPDEVRLLAISKTFPVDCILDAVRAGQVRFGENRVQEAEGKILGLGDSPGLEWHLVGHLQSNKAKRAAQLFDVIHSIDGAALAARVSRAATESDKTRVVLLQVDLGKEATKFGADPARIRGIVEAVSEMPGIRLDGLMTIPPFFEDPEKSRPFYARLRELKERLEAEKPGCLGAGHLSMGMSHDFEEAIREGATIVRVGTAIFGSRQ